MKGDRMDHGKEQVQTEKNEKSGGEERILLKVSGLTVDFRSRENRRMKIRAVDHVSLDFPEGKTLAVVGESGCGKSTLGRAILHLIPHSGGTVTLEGRDLTAELKKNQKSVRKDMQIVFQDPYASLNPRMRVRDIIEEPIIFHHTAPEGKTVDEAATKLMEECGLPTYFKDRYPHEFSGGQRQRICIARALATNPRFIVLDEPVSALDVSIQSQIINLLQDLQEERGLTYMFISHDLSVVHHIADRIAVMYLGSLMEIADKDELYARPTHPYTNALLSAIPKDNPNEKKEHVLLRGEIPSAANPPAGCKFRTRCRFETEKCTMDPPEMQEIAPGHFVACHRCREIMEGKLI